MIFRANLLASSEKEKENKIQKICTADVPAHPLLSPVPSPLQLGPAIPALPSSHSAPSPSNLGRSNSTLTRTFRSLESFRRWTRQLSLHATPVPEQTSPPDTPQTTCRPNIYNTPCLIRYPGPRNITNTQQIQQIHNLCMIILQVNHYTHQPASAGPFS